jgi:hypothetical protein
MHYFLLSEGEWPNDETDILALVSRFRARGAHPHRWHCYPMGLGDENTTLFDWLTSHGGGVYRCGYAKELLTAATAHRRPGLLIKQVRIEGLPTRDLLLVGRRSAVCVGDEITFAARVLKPGAAQIVLEGIVGEHRVVQRFPVVVEKDGTLAARAWGEMAVGSFLALNDPEWEPLATALATEFSIASRGTAFVIPVYTPIPHVWPTRHSPDVGQQIEKAWQDRKRNASREQPTGR